MGPGTGSHLQPPLGTWGESGGITGADTLIGITAPQPLVEPPTWLLSWHRLASSFKWGYTPEVGEKFP